MPSVGSTDLSVVSSRSLCPENARVLTVCLSGYNKFAVLLTEGGRMGPKGGQSTIVIVS